MSRKPIDAHAFDEAAAGHLLRRVVFGASHDDVVQAVQHGLDKTIDRLFRFRHGGASATGVEMPGGLDPDVLKPLPREQQLELRRARKAKDQDTIDRFQALGQQARRKDRQMLMELKQWWLRTMVSTSLPTRELLTLTWHGHFASSWRSVRDTYLMYKQNQHFRDNSLRFDRLVRGIVRDPAMIKYLNNDRNFKRRPNENLARELMELFTLGEGRYQESDIKEGARALTGYMYDDNDFVLRMRQHDRGSKTLFGVNRKFDGDDFAKVLLEHPACSLFVALRLYRTFVADVSDDVDALDPETMGIIGELASLIEQSKFDLYPPLATLLKSQHFYDASVVGQKIKSPVQLVVGTSRSLGLPERDLRTTQNALRMMGQDLFEPPSVAGWEGGRQWINTSTLFVRQNTATYLLTGMQRARRKVQVKDIGYDPLAKTRAMTDDLTPRAVVDQWVNLLLGHHVGKSGRQPLYDFLEGARQGVTGEAVLGLLLLITAMPEYQLC